MTTGRMGMILTCGRINRWKEPCRKSSPTKDKHGHSFSDSLAGPGRAEVVDLRTSSSCCRVTAASLTVPFSSCMVFLASRSLLHHHQAFKQHTSNKSSIISLVIFRCRSILLPLRLPFLPHPSGILSRCLFIHRNILALLSKYHEYNNV